MNVVSWGLSLCEQCFPRNETINPFMMREERPSWVLTSLCDFSMSWSKWTTSLQSRLGQPLEINPSVNHSSTVKSPFSYGFLPCFLGGFTTCPIKLSMRSPSWQWIRPWFLICQVWSLMIFPRLNDMHHFRRHCPSIPENHPPWNLAWR